MNKLRVANNNDTEAVPERRRILLLGGKIEQNLDEIEQALLEQQIGVFRRNDGLVLPGAVSVEVRDGEQIEAKGLIEVCAGSLIEIITGAAHLGRYDARAKEVVSINCPPQIADAYMKRRGRWGLRPLTGIANAPTLRPDGSLLDRPGYDLATGLLYWPQPGVAFPVLPAAPTHADALSALAVLDELICKYLFVSLEARSVAQGNEEETEKRISSALMRGDPVIAIDNITEPLVGAKLLSVLTQQVADLRPLGSSRLVGHDTRALFLFNGNNLTIPGDMCRRVLVCAIDPECEHPERLIFDFDPLERAKAARGRYVMAALTILLAYRAEPSEVAANPLGSYVDWSRWVRDPLLWLGEADPVATIDNSKNLDPVAERIGAVFHHWAEVIGAGVPVTVKNAIAAANGANVAGMTTAMRTANGVNNGAGLLDAFNAVAAPLVRGAGERVDPLRLGKWLGKHKNRVIEGYRIVLVPEKRHGDTQWRLDRVGIVG